MPAFYVQVLQVFIVKGGKCYEVLLGPCPPPPQKKYEKLKGVCFPDYCGQKMIWKKNEKKESLSL